MNEKIIELAEQADIIKRPNKFIAGPDYTISENQLKKFAELIVKECCIVADVAGKQDLLASSVILDYFGIEE